MTDFCMMLLFRGENDCVYLIYCVIFMHKIHQNAFTDLVVLGPAARALIIQDT